MANTPTPLVVKLKSPFNGAVFQHEFIEGQAPDLAAMVQAGFVVVEDEPVKPKAKRDKDVA